LYVQQLVVDLNLSCFKLSIICGTGFVGHKFRGSSGGRLGSGWDNGMPSRSRGSRRSHCYWVQDWYRSWV